jgi:hypothetical protein
VIFKKRKSCRPATNRTKTNKAAKYSLTLYVISKMIEKSYNADIVMLCCVQAQRPLGTGSSSLFPMEHRDRYSLGCGSIEDPAVRITTMPGIDFAQDRARITLAEVLDLIGFVPCEISGDQVRGPCPVHHSTAPSSRSFSASLRLHVDRCFKCGSSGNHLDLYASVTGLGLFEAAVALCEQLRRDIPWMLDATPLRRRPAERFTPEPRSGREPGRRTGSIPRRDELDRAATAEVVPTGPK